jgi:hypothetical protein
MYTSTWENEFRMTKCGKFLCKHFVDTPAQLLVSLTCLLICDMYVCLHACINKCINKCLCV